MNNQYSYESAERRLRSLGFSSDDFAMLEKHGYAPTDILATVNTMLDIGVTTEGYARETFEEANPELFSDEIIAEDAAPADDVSFALSSQSTTVIPREITYDKHGKPEPTIDNFLLFMMREKQYQGIRYNVLAGHAEIHEIDKDGKLTITPWDDAADAKSKHYFELRHDLYSPMKHDAALRIFFDYRKYNPLLDLVESLEWDGQNRCEHFLTEWAKVDDTAYSREVSRLIFAGGINRLYNPGCKFDDIPVLIGTRQGEGKSTLVQWLALNDAYYAITKNMSGDQKSIEAIQGAWIVEISELAAFKNTDIESLKAFCTRTFDKYRLPYDKNTSVFPRRCVFVGTTNNRQFLSDKTGNRRFYPVEVHSDGYNLFDHESKVREYIMQCWAEARERYKAGKMQPVADPALVEVYREKQAEAMEDDWRVGMIEQYLQRKCGGDRVCVKELFDNALFPDDPNRQPTFKESREVGEIMDRMPGWERLPKVAKTRNYGAQRCWQCLPREDDAEIAAVFSS